MRRKDREITEPAEILALIDKCKVCRLGLSENDQAYIVPLNFGYTFADTVLTLFFHSAHEGKKIDLMRKNRRACFEIDCDHRLVQAETACGHGFLFSSVIGFGTLSFIGDAAEKTRALNILMKHQTGKDVPYRYTEAELAAVCVYKMEVDSFTGKRPFDKLRDQQRPVPELLP
jgi:nitroimidazol reductase NimA-like FMN-containing flavoprotein (pyridoxamine 5'-phosphate oxidase superfamily)